MKSKMIYRKNIIYGIIGSILIIILGAWISQPVISAIRNVREYTIYQSRTPSEPSEPISGGYVPISSHGVGRHIGWHLIIGSILSIIIFMLTCYFGIKFFRKKEYGKYLLTGAAGVLGFYIFSLGFTWLVRTNRVMENMAAKPIIYLYPEITQDISVDLDINNPKDSFTTIYPKFTDIKNHSWSVVADPDGTIYLDDKEYSYLFRESINTNSYDLSQGFVIHRDEAVEFLQESLSTLGLTPVEYNEMIVYRLPFIEQSPYSLIHFATPEEYDRRYPLTITPEPDSMLRIFMVIKPLRREIDGIIPQKLETFERKGFSVVEWGGSYLE